MWIGGVGKESGQFTPTSKESHKVGVSAVGAAGVCERPHTSSHSPKGRRPKLQQRSWRPCPQQRRRLWRRRRTSYRLRCAAEAAYTALYHLLPSAPSLPSDPPQVTASGGLFKVAARRVEHGERCPGRRRARCAAGADGGGMKEMGGVKQEKKDGGEDRVRGRRAQNRECQGDGERMGGGRWGEGVRLTGWAVGEQMGVAGVSR